jgi:hypothetical protein
VHRLLHGPLGSTVSLTLARAGSAKHVVKLTRASVLSQSALSPRAGAGKRADGGNMSAQVGAGARAGQAHKADAAELQSLEFRPMSSDEELALAPRLPGYSSSGYSSSSDSSESSRPLVPCLPAAAPRGRVLVSVWGWVVLMPPATRLIDTIS